MPKEKSCIKPYSQGNLDSLCGLYSVINSTKLIIKNITKTDSMILICKCMTALEEIKNKPLSSIFLHGISVHDISCIIKNVIEPHYPIKRHKPFHHKPDISINAYWEAMEIFLNDETSAAIICIEKKTWSHWSVAKSVCSNRIYLSDSDSLKYINKSHCSTQEITQETPVKIYPALTFFLSRSDIKKF